MTRPDEQIIAATPTPKDDALDMTALRRQFPILGTSFHGKPLVYLDNGATTQKPRCVIDAISGYYQRHNANIHRGVYQLSQESTDAYERARRTVARFINAPEDAECIFTNGATEAINLVASCFGRRFLGHDDQVIVSAMEHHSNIVPWQFACQAAGAQLLVIPINDAGELLLDKYAALLGKRTRLVAITAISNALGTINDIKKITTMAHDAGAVVLVDGAQWIGHYATDVQAMGADFFAFSGHKVYGPTGIGVLWGRRKLLDQLPPYQGGGDMIESVHFEKTTYAPLPNKFEAGTPHIAGAIGLAAALDFVTAIGFEALIVHEEQLLAYATAKLSAIKGLRIVGTARRKTAVISLVLDDPPMSALDLGMRLDQEGIAVRTGHHCCQPLMERLHVPATTRISMAMYNTTGEIDVLAEAMEQIVAVERKRRQNAPATTGAAQGTGGAIAYPQPFADSPQAAAEALAEDFDILQERDTRNEYVLDMGRKLPDLFAMLKQVSQPVPGCMSEVYVVGRRVAGDEGRLEFIADANADIVRGLIAILQRLYSGQRCADIMAFDIEAFFRRIVLDQFITSQRRNGLAGMVKRIRSLASQFATVPAASTPAETPRPS